MSRDINLLHPALRNAALKLVEECKKQDINIKITETMRTKQEQDALYAHGRTKPGKIVTNAKFGSSYHNYGLAFDICNNDKTDAYNKDILNKAGAIGKSLGLTWGGDFKSIKDAPHFEYTFGLSLSQLRSGKKPPSVSFINDKCKPNNDFILAVEKLANKGYIRTPEYWLQNEEYELEYFQELVNNIANKHCFKDSIEYLTEKNIINSKDYWINNSTYSAENIRTMIIKLAATI